MSKPAFEIEYERQELARTGKLKELISTYSSKYPEIKDLNTAKLWDSRQYVRTPINKQDGMTKDRVRVASNFVPLFAKRVLDIGVGPGWVEELLEKKNIEIYGNDISPQTVKNIKERFKGSFSVQSLYSLNYKPTFFDTILLLEVLEHVPPSKTFNVLKKINTLLKPGGYLILSVPTNEGLETMKDNPSGHVRMYTVPLINAELELNGFKIMQLKTLYAFPNYYHIKKFLTRFLINKWKPNNIIIQAKKI